MSGVSTCVDCGAGESLIFLPCNVVSLGLSTSAVNSRLMKEEDQTSAVPIDDSVLTRSSVLIHVGVTQASTRMQSVHRHLPLVVTVIVRQANTRVVRVPQHAATVWLVSVQHPVAPVVPLSVCVLLHLLQATATLLVPA